MNNSMLSMRYFFIRSNLASRPSLWLVKWVNYAK